MGENELLELATDIHRRFLQTSLSLCFSVYVERAQRAGGEFLCSGWLNASLLQFGYDDFFKITAMKQILIKQGQAVVEEVPAPQVEPGTILVRIDHSCISVGTEMSGIRSSGLPLWKRAIRQPENVKTVLQMAATQGIGHTRRMVQGQLSAGNPTGYSAAGIILEVGKGIDDLHPGDRVACGGAQCAYHAEIIRVPRKPCCPDP